MSFGARIQELRMKNKESLQDVANSIEVSKTHLWELEKGRAQNPSVELIKKLADHFRVTISYLLGEEIMSQNENDDLIRMYRQMGELSGRDREILDDMIQSLLSRRKKQNAED